MVASYLWLDTDSQELPWLRSRPVGELDRGTNEDGRNSNHICGEKRSHPIVKRKAQYRGLDMAWILNTLIRR